MNSRVSSCLTLALACSLQFTWVPTASAQANVQGQWKVLSNTVPINPVHASLLSNGSVLVVAGSGNCPPSQSGCPSGPPYGPSNGSGALLLNPVTGQTLTQFSLTWDMFCNGMVLLPDGRVMINGGTIQYDPFHGQPLNAIFDPSNNTFSNTQNMAHGRWYPTVLTLGDGRIMTFSGLDENSNTNYAVEFYTVGTGWSTQYFSPWVPDLYPRLHLLPNGTVLYSGAETVSRIFDPSSITWNSSASTNYGGTRTYGTSVLLPLTPANNYDPKVVIMGGGSPATATTEIIDMGAATPNWVTGLSMSQPRIEMNAVILPNGEILAVGGSKNDEDTSTLSLNADLFDLSTVDLTATPPNFGTMTSAGANASQRLYHSVALLLPDATVWLAGGNPSRGTYNNTMEIYQPPYLFNSDGTLATRPSITNAPSFVSYGNAFTVTTPDVANISSAVLVRNGSVTHAFGMDQREVGLSFTAGSGALTVTAPPNGNIAPPGYYMLFLLNSSGVPSVASFVQVGNAQVVAPAAPTNLTAARGNGQVGLSWTGSTGATSYNVKRSTTNGGPYSTIGNPTTTSYTDSGLTNGTTYYYVVTAVNAAGESAPSAQASATPQVTVPAAPTNLTAAGGNGQVGLNWTGSSGATSYNVKRSTTNGGPYATIASPTTTNYTDSGLTNGTTYYYVVTAVNAAGESINSGQASAMPATLAINYGGGFSPTGMQLNGSTTLNGTRLRLTDGGGSEAASAYYTTPVNVQSFTTNFSIQQGSAQADGMTFVIQNNGLTAIGSPGGGLGYGPEDAGTNGGMSESLAVKFDLYSNAGEGTDSTGMYTGGAWPTMPAVDMTSSGVTLRSGHVMNVQLSYDGTTLGFTITDTSTQASFTTSWAVNIPSAVGGNTALVGFTAGTGGGTAVQDVLNWTYSAGTATAAPGAPTNLAAIGAVGQVGLSWTGSSGATSYNVKRSTTSGGPYTTIASPTTTTYTDGVVTNGTTYYYVVTAVNAGGESASSSQVSATPQAVVPVAPTNLTAAGVNAQVQLSWTGSTGATSYNVKRSTTNGGPYSTIGNPTTTSYTDSGLTNGTTYYYVVTAVNAAGESAPSAQASATPQVTVPAAPTNLTAAGGNGQVGLNWTGSSGATSYNVKRSTTNGGPYATIASPTTTNYTDSGLTNGTTYYYVVTAVNAAGESINSGQASAMPATLAINYGGGFSPTGMQLNGSTTLNGTRLRLTDGGGSEAASAYYTTPVNVQSFTTNFSIQQGSAQADGMTFVIQNNGLTAIGSPGGGLGYGPEDAGTNGGMSESLAVKFDLYSNAGEGTDSTGMYTGGAWPTMPAVDMTSSGVTLRSGHVMNVQLSYDGTTLGFTITDTSTQASFTTSWAVNIPSAVGGNTALVGFTAGTGGGTAVQDVLNWTYSAGTATAAPGAPTNLAAIGAVGQVGLSWTGSSGATSYNVKRSTTSGGPYTTIASPTTTTYTDGVVTNGTTYYYVVTAVNAGGESSPASQVSATPHVAAPVITSGTTASGTVGTAFTYQIVATNSPTNYAATGLPAGLGVNSTTGQITGTPTATGTSTVTISATNNGGTGNATLTLTVNPAAPMITSGTTASGPVGSAFSYQITATNSPTSYGASGLPAGLAVSSTTGLISGTPTATGTSTVTLSATNSGGTGSATMTLTVNPAAPVITSGTVASGTVGAPFTYQIVATNSPTSYGASGLPAGLAVSSTTGLISGTPSATGTSTVTLSATNSGGTGNATLTLTVNNTAAPVITSGTTAIGTLGTAFTYQIVATNSPTSYGATGLPAGLTVSGSTGLVSGMPTMAGQSTVTLSATNAGGTGKATLTLTINPPAPVITSATSASGTIGSAFTYQITATNSPTSYGATGLPAGLTLSSTTGVISGTPTGAATSTVTIQATNGGGTGSATLTLTVSPAAPVITSATTASGTVGSAFTYQITATNSPTSYGATGLPAGLTVSSTTGLISGTPTAAATSTVTIKATNSGGTGSATLTLTVNAASSSPSSMQIVANASSGLTSTFSLSFPQNTVAGDLILVAFDYDTNSTPSSVTDSQGNTFTAVGTQLTTPGGARSRVYYAKSIKGGADTVTVKLSANSAWIELYLAEYTGADPSAPVDTQKGVSGSAGSVSSGNATTTTAGDLIFGYCVGDSACNPGAGFATRSHFNNNLVEDKLAGSAGAYAATGSANNGWTMQMVALKP